MAVHRLLILRLAWTACCNADGGDPPRVSGSGLPGWGLGMDISSMFPGDAAAAGRDHTESHWLRLSLGGVLGHCQQSSHGTNRGTGIGRHIPVTKHPFCVLLSVLLCACHIRSRGTPKLMSPTHRRKVVLVLFPERQTRFVLRTGDLPCGSGTLCDLV